MRICKEMDFNDLVRECWCGAEDTLNIISDHNKEDALMDLLEECFSGDVPTMTEINDLLRFDDEWLFETLDISEEDEEEDDDDDEDYWDDDYDEDFEHELSKGDDAYTERVAQEVMEKFANA